MVNVNLGSGFQKKEGFLNVDLDSPDADIHADLEKSWDFVEPGTVDNVLAAHIFEHLHNPIFTFNELYKILKVGGRAEIHLPSTDGRGAFQDPTHVSFYNKNSWRYYCSNVDFGLWNLCRKYGFKGNFKQVEYGEYTVPENIICMRVVLEKVAV